VKIKSVVLYVKLLTDRQKDKQMSDKTLAQVNIVTVNKVLNIGNLKKRC